MFGRRSVVRSFVFGGCFVVSAGAALAAPIYVSGTTSGFFSTGTPAGLTFTGTSFSGTTAADGSLNLPDLGLFDLALPQYDEHFNGYSFTLNLDFADPLITVNPILLPASLSGAIKLDNKGKVNITFNPSSQLLSFTSGATLGIFVFSINDVLALERGGTATLIGNITGASINSYGSVPEPTSVFLLGSALCVIAVLINRKPPRLK